MSSDPAVVAQEVRAQVTEVALICNRVLATTGPFAHPHAIRNDLMSAIIALELAELQPPGPNLQATMLKTMV